MPTTTSNGALPNLHATIVRLIAQFDNISAVRKETLEALTAFVSNRTKSGQKARLNFICTHNSRRSHISQLWAQAAAHFYGIKNVETFSGGTEATAFNPRAVTAMKHAGFDIHVIKEGTNPLYEVKFAHEASPLRAFSKKYDDHVNPKNDFAAVMTCSHADENCPLIIGAATRIALTYDDPKDFDGTPHETEKYLERVDEIGRDILYAFSKVR